MIFFEPHGSLHRCTVAFRLFEVVAMVIYLVAIMSERECLCVINLIDKLKEPLSVFCLFTKKRVFLQTMKNKSRLIPVLLSMALLVSCNDYSKILKSNDYDKKYEAAMAYYNENSYSKAIQLFENLNMHYRGKENAENIAWYYAQALMKEEDYYSAGYHFQRFTRQFPYSEHAEEAAYLSAKCKYEESSPYTLDQGTTKEAIKSLEHFTERYPHSVHVPEVNGCLDELREKLLKKEYEIAMGYYRIEAYHAAYISLQNFVNQYPEAPQREDAMFYMLKSGYEYASNSTAEKISERTEQVINDFEKFSTTYASSAYLPEAQAIYTKSRAILAGLEKAN